MTAPRTMPKRSDPFTTDSARVVDRPADPLAIDREAQPHLRQVKAMFGHLGELHYKKYFSDEAGLWRVGFKSFFGFHTRGSGSTAAEAVARMVRQADDPCQHWDSWVPGSFSKPFEPFTPPARSCECSAA